MEITIEATLIVSDPSSEQRERDNNGSEMHSRALVVYFVKGVVLFV
jgi:hypothetical protein